MSDLAAVKIVARGRVQGVFFRDFTTRRARELGLTNLKIQGLYLMVFWRGPSLTKSYHLDLSFGCNMSLNPK